MSVVAKYSMDFKKNAVSIFKQEGITRTCRQLHVTRATIYRWVKQDDSISVERSEKDEATAAEGGKIAPQATERVR